MLNVRIADCRFYVVANRDPRAVWNWRSQHLAWDLDADYRAAEWSYRTKGGAARVKARLNREFILPTTDIYSGQEFRQLWKRRLEWEQR